MYKGPKIKDNSLTCRDLWGSLFWGGVACVKGQRGDQLEKDRKTRILKCKGRMFFGSEVGFTISIAVLNHGRWPLWWHAGDPHKRKHTNVPSWMGRRGSGENIEQYLWEEEENICKIVNPTRLPREVCVTSSSGCEWTSCSFTFRKCMLKVARKLHVCVPEASFCWLQLSSGLCCCTCGCGWPGHVFSEDVLGGRFFFSYFSTGPALCYNICIGHSPFLHQLRRAVFLWSFYPLH